MKFNVYQTVKSNISNDPPVEIKYCTGVSAVAAVAALAMCMDAANRPDKFASVIAARMEVVS